MSNSATCLFACFVSLESLFSLKWPLPVLTSNDSLMLFASPSSRVQCPGSGSDCECYIAASSSSSLDSCQNTLYPRVTSIAQLLASVITVPSPLVQSASGGVVPPLRSSRCFSRPSSAISGTRKNERKTKWLLVFLSLSPSPSPSPSHCLSPCFSASLVLLVVFSCFSWKLVSRGCPRVRERESE